MSQVRYIPISNQQLLEKHGIPFKPATLYKWHCIGKYPDLFKKISGKLLLSLDAWHQLTTTVED